MRIRSTALVAAVGIVAAAVGVPAGAAYAGSGTTKLGVYELSVTPNGSAVFDKAGVAGTMKFKTAPSSQIPTVEARAGETEQYYLTLPGGLEFASGAERSGICVPTPGIVTIACRMDPDRRHFYIDFTWKGTIQRSASPDPRISFPVVSTGRITGTARAIYKPVPNVRTEAPCTTAAVPADAEPEAFDVIKALAKAYPNQNLNTDDLLMNVRSARILDQKLEQTDKVVANALDADNRTADKQTWSTRSRTETVTSTATVTNEHKASTAGKVGNSFKITIMEIFETSVSWELGFSAENSNSTTETKTKTESVTYPSQTLIVPPNYHGKIDYMLTKGRATGKIESIGEFGGKIGISNCDGSNWRTISVGDAFRKASGFLPSWVHPDGTFTWMSRFTADAAAKEFISAETWPIPGTSASKKAQKSLKVVKNNADVTRNKR